MNLLRKTVIVVGSQTQVAAPAFSYVHDGETVVVTLTPNAAAEYTAWTRSDGGGGLASGSSPIAIGSVNPNTQIDARSFADGKLSSDLETFLVPALVPDGPTPEDAATGVSTTPQYAWGPDQDSLGVTYDLYLRVGGVGAFIKLAEDLADETYLQETPISYETACEWYVVAKVSGADDVQGPTWTFTTETEQ